MPEGMEIPEGGEMTEGMEASQGSQTSEDRRAPAGAATSEDMEDAQSAGNSAGTEGPTDVRQPGAGQQGGRPTGQDTQDAQVDSPAQPQEQTGGNES